MPSLFMYIYGYAVFLIMFLIYTLYTPKFLHLCPCNKEHKSNQDLTYFI